MSGWEIGDLAVCVDDTPGRGLHINPVRTELVKGRVYRVVGFGKSRRDAVSLFIEGATATDQEYGFGFALRRFRKVKPDAHEGEMEDWQMLIDAMRVPEKAA